MNNLFRDRYRIPSARLQTYDYRISGWYFVTICTKNREPWFGKIRNGIVGLSDVGCSVAKYWQSIPVIYHHVTLDHWVIMPDHIHGIIVLNDMNRTVVETCQWRVSTDVRMCIPLPVCHAGSLGAIINQFKMTCTKHIRSMGYTDFAWQTRFYDQIMWDPEHINNVRKYIRLNPIRWNNDT